MTAPRQVLPGTTYLVTRRCAQREFLLKPSALTTAVFKFVLAVAAKRHGIVLHAACVMSDHYHLVLTDPRADLPRFNQLLDGVVARALNASYGRSESFWAPSSYSAVTLVSPEDVLDKIVYTLANPVSAGLVARGEEWPGLWSAPERVGTAGEIVQRPARFFSKKGTMPERELLTFAVPRGFASKEAFRAEVAARLAAREREKAEELASRGERVQGVHRVLRQRHTDRARSYEQRGGLKPQVASRDRWKRIEALGRRVEFLQAYRDALEKLRGGYRDVVFPPGTYQLRVHLCMACEAA
jgi:REP element-mobilizing transposase RayT